MSPTPWEWPDEWPINPNLLEPPPTPWPYLLDDLDVPQLQHAIAALTIMCGRSKTPLKSKQRAIICVLSTILQYELDKRQPPDSD